MLKLLDVTVPTFEPEIRSLVNIRHDDERFNEWRVALGSCLGRLGDLNVDDPEEMHAAREDMRQGMEPMRRRIEGAARKSPAISALRLGTADFAISGVAATVGTVLGGHLGPSLLTAGVLKSADAAKKFSSARADKKSALAALDLLMLFEGA
ncbi:hypothetical protein [Paractinoplanes atraurantiacus]|uniref:hypothetical protein n=1 Tax=Paractinoplanes atraurantiacus TaxID=1036182 RepID=UPI001177A3F9|nr:hypothetical protein [Actinoplanes atraurantiacus]